MKIEATNPRTGETLAAELTEGQQSKLTDTSHHSLSDQKLSRFIKTLNLSDDAESLIAELEKVTVRIGEETMKIGRQIIEVAIELQTRYPYTTFGLILGLTASILIASIPLLGSILGTVLTPLLVALGVAIGFNEDIRDNALYQKFVDNRKKWEAWTQELPGWPQNWSGWFSA